MEKVQKWWEFMRKWQIMMRTKEKLMSEKISKRW
jgi:hypothetical protein